MRKLVTTVQTLGLGLGQASSLVSPAAAPDGHVWCLMGKRPGRALTLPNEVSSVETTPNFAFMGLGGEEGTRKQ